ncbi:YheC/YheD family protein [Paenibacillus sp. DXFW5]|uniref:YheC/YheD family protein n=1 Tax=Paenibacillus rhizolycopersici TaxID=2780073 RepID=A0ABS2H894_9BACL|nr:YheC/YheD family protein [Paenibacillus rhizolycopersici]MBM6996075.1 YheC/YheD family protein [Paenibacillus rhizolycopersici]
MSQDTVGILLNSSMYRGIPTHRTGQEWIAGYEETAREYGLIPIFLRLGGIDSAGDRCVAYVYNGIEYVEQELPLPSVIHNRALYPRLAAHKKLQSLKDRGITVFNVNNRYGKDFIHRLLWNAPHLRAYLPAAMPLTSENLRRMMSRHPDLILKPIRGSVGHGVMRLQYARSTGWELTYASPIGKRRWNTVRLHQRELPAWTRRMLRRTPYLVQERIPLAEYEGRPIDLRITVQRGSGGDWGVTGRFAKVAAAGSFVCNIAKGGEALPAEELLAKALPEGSVPSALAHVENLALAISHHLGGRLPLLADLGLDIGLTESGRPYFIECNGRDQRYGFRKAGLPEIWKDSYRQPMAYARYLLGQPEQRNVTPQRSSE